MIWNVFYFDVNKKKIIVRNLFEMSITFNGDFEKFKYTQQGNTTREDFERQLKLILMYTFWCRRDYEIAMSDLCWTYPDATDGDKLREYDHYEKTATKVDVYSQVMANWDRFVDYVWKEVKGNE